MILKREVEFSFIFGKIFLFIMNRKNERYREDLHEYRCDERLKPNPERSTRLVYTGWCEGLEHLKIKTRLIYERFTSVMGECVI